MSMRTVGRIFLALAVLTLAASYTEFGSNFLGGAFKPLAAILFIVFFIIQLTKDQIPQYDEDRRRSLEEVAAAAAEAEAQEALDEDIDGEAETTEPQTYQEPRELHSVDRR